MDCLFTSYIPAELVPLGCLVNAGLGSYRQDVGWSYLIRSTLNNYQSWFVLLIIILATGAAVLVGELPGYLPVPQLCCHGCRWVARLPSCPSALLSWLPGYLPVPQLCCRGRSNHLRFKRTLFIRALDTKTTQQNQMQFCVLVLYLIFHHLTVVL